MKSGKGQFLIIILALVIALGSGFGGGYLALSASQNTGVGEKINQILHIDTGKNTGKLPDEAGKNPQDMPQSQDPAVSPQQNVTIETNDSITVAEAVAEKVLPSVVGISISFDQTVGSSGFPFDFGFGFGFGGGGGGYSQEVQGVGTGVIVDPAGFILTNSHVVNDGDTKSINVSLYNGKTVEGLVVWNDSTLDLAIVKINETGLAAAELGDSDLLKIGTWAAAIGNPLGLEFERSMSQGIISGKDRVIEVGESSSSLTTMEGLLQTDATINSGNSGGPLLNAKGEVIGINTAKASDGEGMGFAIPINIAKPIVEQIKNTGKFERPYLGISGNALSSYTGYTSAQLEEMLGVSNGVYVAEVSKGGGAEAAGIQKGDVITELEGTKITTMNKLNSMLIRYKMGDTVHLTVVREKEEMGIDVTLTSGQPIL